VAARAARQPRELSSASVTRRQVLQRVWLVPLGGEREPRRRAAHGRGVTATTLPAACGAASVATVDVRGSPSAAFLACDLGAGGRASERGRRPAHELQSDAYPSRAS